MEISDINNFAASFALDNTITNDAIVYEMYVYQDTIGESMIANTQREIRWLEGEYKEVPLLGKSYGMSDDQIDGTMAGLRAKIDARKKAIEKMQGARAEYEKYKKQAFICTR